jgi:hypothetical protein
MLGSYRVATQLVGSRVVLSSTVSYLLVSYVCEGVGEWRCSPTTLDLGTG